MRVLHFVESFSNLTETFIYDQIVEGQRQDIESWVVALRRLNVVDRPFDRVHTIALPPRWSPERIWSRIVVKAGRIEPDLQYSQIMRRRIKRFISSLKPDVIHSHFGPAGYLAMPVAQALGIPLVVSFYGYDVTKLVRSVHWRHRYEKLFVGADALIALSNLMREQLLELGGPAAKLWVVHLAKRLAAYPYREPAAPVENWISVGRLSEKKGHGDTISAFEAATRGTHATLTIVGDGELRSALAEQLSASGLSRRVLLAGSLPHRDVIKMLRGADAFILCSKMASDGDSEGTPTVILEAQAVGLPCVATRHSGIPEMIPAENQRFLAEEGNIPDIVERMKLLCRASQEELVSISLAGRHKVEQEFRVEREVTKLLKIYSSIGLHGRYGSSPEG